MWTCKQGAILLTKCAFVDGVQMCTSVKHVRTCEWRWKSVKGKLAVENRVTYLLTKPLRCEWDLIHMNGTTHFWTKPVDYQFTNGGPIHIWQSSHTRRYRLHVEDHGQPITTCERDLYVWPGLPRVNGTCMCERVLYLWRTLHPWTRHPVSMERDVYVLNSTDDSYTC